MESASPPVSPEETAVGTPEEDKKTRIIRYGFLFAMPFLMVTMMFSSYVGTMHSPEPKDMPVAVIGSSEQARTALQFIADSPDATLETRSVPTEAEAQALIDEREVAGAISFDSATGDTTIYTAMAAGGSQASVVEKLLSGVAAQQNSDIEVFDVAPLPPGDSSGTVVLFGAMGMVLAAYVPLSLLMLSLPHLLTLRRFVPLVAGWSIFTSSVIWLILGPIVGAVDGHYLDFLAVGMLTTIGVGLAQLLFTKVMGPLAVLLGMLLYVVLGMPASNLALSIHTMPGFFSFLHGVLPLPAAGEALRSLIYFDGVGVSRHLTTLAAWIVVALVLCLLKERRGGTAIPGAPVVDNPEVPLPALSGGPLRSKRFRYVAAVLFPLSIMVMVVGVMGFAMHKPDVRDLPVAVVASADGAADATITGLEPGLGSILDLEVAPSVEEALGRMDAQELVGVYVLPSTPGEQAVLYSSSGAGASQQTAVQAIFEQISTEQQSPLELVDVAPLSSTDTMGSNSLYFGMSWIMAGFLMLAVLRGGAPELRTLRSMLPFLGGWSIGMAVWLWLLFDVIIGAVGGHALEMIGVGVITIFSASLVTAVLTRTLGLAAIVPVMVVLLLAGVPASGGGLSVYMVPDLFRGLQDYLPLPAAVDIARSMVYFDSSGVGRNLAVIVVWGIIGLLLNLVVDRWRARGGPGSTGSLDKHSDDSTNSAPAFVGM